MVLLSFVYLLKFSFNNKILLFILISLLTVYGLVYLELLSLSPTRHLLGLSVFFLVVFFHMLNFLFSCNTRKNTFILFCGIVVFLTSLKTYPIFFNGKTQKISYETLFKLIKVEKIDYIIDYNRTSYISNMFPLTNYSRFKDDIKDSQQLNYRILLVSHRGPLRNEIDKLKAFKANPEVTIERTLINKSKIEVGRNPYAKNGTNNSYIYIINYKN